MSGGGIKGPRARRLGDGSRGYRVYGDGLSLGNGVREVTIAMLKKGVLTAVYKGREYPPERGREQPERPAQGSGSERAR